MARRYSASFVAVAVTALQDFFSVAVAADEPVTILACYINQISDVGDTAEEMLRVDIVRGNDTVGSGGSAATEILLDARGGAASAAVRVNDTTEASAGSEEIAHTDAFNIRVGWQYIPIPELRIRHDSGGGTNEFICVRLLTAPADELTMNGTLYWEEG